MKEHSTGARATNLIALLLCETIITDSRTGARSLINIIYRIAPLTFPYVTVLQAFQAFAILSDIKGKTRVRFRVVCDDDEQVLVESQEAEIDLADPLVSPEIDCPLWLQFDHPGQCALELLADGDMVQRRRIYLLDASGTNGGET